MVKARVLVRPIEAVAVVLVRLYQDLQLEENMAHTKYSNLLDDELLKHVADVRARSPIIEELCQRLEVKIHSIVIAKDSNSRVECPACEAHLFADYDCGNGMFTIKFPDKS